MESLIYSIVIGFSLGSASFLVIKVHKITKLLNISYLISLLTKALVMLSTVLSTVLTMLPGTEATALLTLFTDFCMS